jgi:nickel/cobalt transporter (NiCoT) family protein
MFRDLSQSLTIAGSPTLEHKVGGMFALLVGANLFLWLFAFILFEHHSGMLSICLLAWTFGLRHAVDADHIAAIDNVTRKLMNDGQRPVGVGFFFSLGHSTIVICLSIAIAFGAEYVHGHYPGLEKFGGIFGTLVSGAFLFLIATINLFVFLNVYRMFQKIRTEGTVDEQAMDEQMEKRGLYARILRPLLKLVRHSWQMYPIGFLFGLGFDTATEVGLLGISATQASAGMPVWYIMMFPALFTAGMCLVDTADGILMLGAYGWAFLDPMRKLFYNAFITLLGFLVAFFVGAVEVLGIIGQEFNLAGGIWRFIGGMNDHFGVIGYGLIGIFAICWLAATYMYRTAHLSEK